MKKYFLTLLAMLGVGLLFGGGYTAVTSGDVSALTSGGEACFALKEFDDTIKCDENGKVEDVNSTLTKPIETVMGVLSLLVGLASAVMIIFGGFKYTTSGGNSEATKSARNTIIYACVGLAVALLAQVIIRVVFRTATDITGSTSASPTTFNLRASMLSLEFYKYLLIG